MIICYTCTHAARSARESVLPSGSIRMIPACGEAVEKLKLATCGHVRDRTISRTRCGHFTATIRAFASARLEDDRDPDADFLLAGRVER